MNSNEAAELLNMLHGAYPGTYFDGSVAEVFSNSLITNDYAPSKQAVTEWVQRVDRFPTIAELNATIRRLKGGSEDNVRQIGSGHQPCDMETAKAAFARGYRQARVKAGDDDETIERKLAGYFTRFPMSVLGKVGS